MKVVFIDIDNTLLSFDGYVKEGMRKGFEKFGLRPYEPWMYDVFREENDKLWCMIERKELTFEELKKIRWNIIFRRLGIDSDGPVFETYFRNQLNESAIPVDGAMKMLENLHERYILAAASNGPYEQQVHRITLAGMDKYLDYLFISEKIGCSKPDREFFMRALDEINGDLMQAGRPAITPDECVMIGDSLTSDMAGGRNAGMHTCYYRRKKDGTVKGDTVNSDVDIVIDSLREAAPAIERL